MLYNYFIPLIHLGPPKNYTYYQEIPMEYIKKLIVGKNAEININRKVFLNKKLLLEKNEILIFKNNRFINDQVAFFKWKEPQEKQDLSYIETQMNLISGIGLKSPSLPGFYVNYTSPNKKNFISCGVEKYGNPRVIDQRQEFGIWVDGYPAVNISYKNNTTYSLVIINPYKTNNTFTIEINDLKIKQNVRVNAFAVKKINFFEIIKNKEWTGQFYIYGKRRAIIYLMNHSIKDNTKVSTLEHGDPFRAELTYQPRFQLLRHLVHKKIKKIIN